MWRHPLFCIRAGLNSLQVSCIQQIINVQFKHSKRQDPSLTMNVGRFAWWIICCRLISDASLIDFRISEHVCICGSLCMYATHSLVGPEGDFFSHSVLVFHIVLQYTILGHKYACTFVLQISQLIQYFYTCKCKLTQMCQQCQQGTLCIRGKAPAKTVSSLF